MAIRPDGFLEGRIETLYVSQEYKMFMLTGQPGRMGRNAYVSVRPFNTLEKDEIARLSARAETPDASSRLTISSDQANLNIYDGFTGTTSQFPLSELDTDVRERLQYKAPSKSGFGTVWDKYTKGGNDATSASGTPVKPAGGRFNL